MSKPHLPVELSPHTLAKILAVVDDALYELLMQSIARGDLIVSDITPIIEGITNSERRVELVKAVCLRNIRQGDSS